MRYKRNAECLLQVLRPKSTDSKEAADDEKQGENSFEERRERLNKRIAQLSNEAEQLERDPMAALSHDWQSEQTPLSEVVGEFGLLTRANSPPHIPHAPEYAVL